MIFLLNKNFESELEIELNVQYNDTHKKSIQQNQ